MLRLLRQRDFGLLWLGGLVSIAGDWVLYAALPYFVYQQTGSTVATAGMIVAELTPGVILGSIAGVFVDRWERKQILVVTNLIQAAVVASLLLAQQTGGIWIVYVVAAVQSAVASFSEPAESALLPSLVHDDELVTANALNALNNRIGRLVGLSLGAVLLGAFGLEAVVAVDAATFVLAAVLIAAISVPPVVPPEAELEATDAAMSAWSAFWGEWIAGLAVVRREREIALLFFVLGLMTFGGTMLDPLAVAWVRDILGQGPSVYALLMTAHAASGIVGTLIVGSFGKQVSPRMLIGVGSLVAGVTSMVKYNVPVVWLAFALSLVTGISSVASAVGVETLVQQAVGPEFRGRVFGSLGATMALLSLLGAAVGGIFGELLGMVLMLSVASGLILLAGVVVLYAYRPSRSRSEAVGASPASVEPFR